MIRDRRLVVALALAASVIAAPARAELTVVPPRAGQVGLSVQGQYGMLLDSGPIGGEFNSGPGLAVRLRYRMRYERAMGLSFETQRFDVRQPAAADTAFDHMSVFAYGIDAYQMFGTKTRTARWLGVGVGLVQFRRTQNNGDINFGADTDGAYVSAGVGAERFFWQSWAFDLSGRYLAVFQNGEINHDFQASLGLIVYAAY